MFTEARDFAKNYLKIERPPELKLVSLGRAGPRGQYRPSLNLIEINIDIDSQKYERLVETLFHEFTHCKQLEAGWLKTSRTETGETLYFWKKSRPKGTGYQVKNMIDYRTSPHEIQARDVAKVMLKLFLAKTKIKLDTLETIGFAAAKLF